jgi:transcription elongation GreA/GreB family factor
MENKLSDDSPFGRAIVGKAEGEQFTVNAPNGAYTMEVLAVSREG